MITNRSKMRLDDAAPVLFRLPNLRSRSSRPTASETLANVVSKQINDDFTGGPSSVPPRSEAATSVQTPRPERQSDFKESFAGAKVTAAESATQTGIASEVGISVQTAYAAPVGRSWMEQIGSRLILIFTLLIIVSAAWLTGNRMPASKPGSDSDGQVAQASGQSAGSVQLPEISPGELQPEVMSDAKKSPVPMLAGSAGATTTGETPVKADLLPQEKQDGGTIPETNIVSEPVGSFSPTNVTQLLPPSDLSPRSTGSSNFSRSEVANQNQTVALKPSAEQKSIAQLDSPFYLPEDTPTGNRSIPVSAVSLQTRTPDAPNIDPAVLVPWAHDNSKTPKHQASATPNPIKDWSRYLPGTTSTSNVRTTSATAME